MNVGPWRLVPEIGRLMLFQRVGALETNEARREVKLAGVWDGPNQLAGLFNFIEMSQLGGALSISSGDRRKVLFFRGGDFLGARSNAVEDRLGEFLVRTKLITVEQRDACIADVKRGSPLGNVLVSRGVMKTNEVFDALRNQAIQIFASTLRFASGSYYIVAPLDISAVPAMLHLDTQTVLLESLRRLDEEAHEPEPDPEPEFDPSEFEEHNLTRAQPVAQSDLPIDGPTVIIDTYNEALRSLLTAVDSETRTMLVGEICGFIDDASLLFEDIFDGVGVSDAGELDRETIMNNLASSKNPDAVDQLQTGLSEMLFFLLFAAGDAVEDRVQNALRQNVAITLRKLPQHSSKE